MIPALITFIRISGTRTEPPASGCWRTRTGTGFIPGRRSTPPWKQGAGHLLELVPSTDPSGHGTAVAAIAAGNGREGNGVYRGVAYESELMVVKLGTPLTDSFPRTTQLMKALDLVVRRARDMNRPLAVNISFGNTYGSHDGTSLLETFINDMSNIGRNVIVAGTGNEGTGAGHRAGSLVMGQEENAQLSIAPYETGMGVQLWKSYVDQFSIRLVTPSGEVIGPIDRPAGPPDPALRGNADPDLLRQAQSLQPGPGGIL